MIRTRNTLLCVKGRSWAVAAFVATVFAVLVAERVPMGWSCRTRVPLREVADRCDPVTLISVGATHVLVVVLLSVLAAVVINRRPAFIVCAVLLWLLVVAGVAYEFFLYRGAIAMGIYLLPAAGLMTVAAAASSTRGPIDRWLFLRSARTT